MCIEKIDSLVDPETLLIIKCGNKLRELLSKDINISQVDHMENVALESLHLEVSSLDS